MDTKLSDGPHAVPAEVPEGGSVGGGWFQAGESIREEFRAKLLVLSKEIAPAIAVMTPSVRIKPPLAFDFQRQGNVKVRPRIGNVKKSVFGDDSSDEDG